MRTYRAIFVGLALLAGQLTAAAADLAVLRNGSSIPFIRKEQIGDVTRLYITGGHMDVPTSEIVSFDKDDSPAPPDSSQPEAPSSTASATPATQTQPAAATTAPAAVSTVALKTQAAAPTAASQADLDQLVREASLRYQLDPDFVASVIRAESNFKPHAVSRKGAQGLMQLMPQTAAQLGVKDAFDPRANVEAGTAHLSALLDQYHNDPIKALAAYNAGAHRVKQYNGVPPYRETRAYVAKIVHDFNSKKRAQMKLGKPAAAGTKSASTPQKKPATQPPQRSASVAKATKPA